MSFFSSTVPEEVCFFQWKDAAPYIGAAADADDIEQYYIALLYSDAIMRNSGW